MNLSDRIAALSTLWLVAGLGLGLSACCSRPTPIEGDGGIDMLDDNIRLDLDVPDQRETPEVSTCLGAPTNASGAGGACLGTNDCDPATAQQCVPPANQTYLGEVYTTWNGGYCLPIFPGACGETTVQCPDGTLCDGPYQTTTGPVSYCWDQCANGNTTWGTSNCDCRDRYECDIQFNLCFPGCSNDRECCEIWTDANGNFIREAGEVTMAAGCTGTCNTVTYRCDYPGGPVAIGEACTHDSECPRWGRCLTGYPGGYCVLDSCNLSGRACPVVDQCRNLGTSREPRDRCVDTCIVASAPDPFMQDPACRGGYACAPLPQHLTAPENGFCAPGNYTSFTDNTLGAPGAIGGPCADPDGPGPLTSDSQCYSPYGLADCADARFWPDTYWPGGFCTVYYCSVPGLSDQCGTGRACIDWGGGFSACMTTCTPGGAPGTNGCRDGFACTSAYFGADVCFARCPAVGGDAWCSANLNNPALRCNVTTGVCE